MLPGIKNGDRLKVSRLDARSRSQLVRGDILVFRFRYDQAKWYIKRLIGLPGDEMEIRRGEVWINGSPSSEPYLDQKLNLAQRSTPKNTVPLHAYFVMGDNRDNSSDSRFWGPVPEQLVEAKVIK